MLKIGQRCKVVELEPLDEDDLIIGIGEDCEVKKILRVEANDQDNLYAVNFFRQARREPLQGMPDGYEDWYPLFEDQLEPIV